MFLFYFCFVEPQVSRRPASSRMDGKRQLEKTCTTSAKPRIFVQNNSMTDTGGKLKQCRIVIPEALREWIVKTNRENKAAGNRMYTIQRVAQAIIDETTRAGLDRFFESVEPETVKDYRGRPNKI